MAAGRSPNRRRAAQEFPGQSKAEMRNDLNRMIQDFLAKGGTITDCNGCLPGKNRKIPPAPGDDGVLQDLWD